MIFNQEGKQKHWVMCCTLSPSQSVQALWISHLNCPECERTTDRVLRGKSTGDRATHSVIDPWVRLSNLTPLSMSCLQHRSFLRQRPPRSANSILSELSITTPARARPLFPSISCTQSPAAPPVQTARLGPWLRLSIGSYGNGRLSPYCLIG